MPGPLVYGGMALGGALLKGLFGMGAKKKQAEQQKKAAAELKAAEARRLAAQRGYFDADQTRRGFRYDAANQALGNMQGSLGAGAPNYQLSPDILAGLKAPLPFYGAMGPDPTVVDPGAGLGYNFLSGLAGGISDAGRSAMLGGMQGGGGADGLLQGDTGILSGSAPGAAEAVGAAAEDRGNICALLPTLPGCPQQGV